MKISLSDFSLIKRKVVSSTKKISNFLRYNNEEFHLGIRTTWHNPELGDKVEVLRQLSKYRISYGEFKTLKEGFSYIRHLFGISQRNLGEFL